MLACMRGSSSSPSTQQPRPKLCKLTLLLYPPQLEQKFWTSVRVLKFFDAVGLFNSVILNVLLIRKFGWGSGQYHMLWHFLPVLLYLTAGLAQLAMLLLKPELHQQHRFVINLANRLVKAATVTWAAVNMSQTDVMVQFTGTLNNVPRTPAGGQRAMTYMKILRTVGSLPLLWVSHAVNFMLPFWLLLPLQLYTLLAVSSVVPSVVCALLRQPAHILQPALVIAMHVRSVVRVLLAVTMPLAAKWPWTAASPPGNPDSSSEQDLLVLVAITFTLILLTIPCVVAYHVEALWKSDFLRMQLLQLERASGLSRTPHEQPWPASPFWATFDVVCISLLVCEVIVQLAPGLQCDSHP